MTKLQRVYRATDISGRIYQINTLLAGALDRSTTHLASLGGAPAQPSSMTRRWAVRLLTAGAVAVVPALPLAALSVGPLALVAFGVGHDPRAPRRSNIALRAADMLRQYGLLGLPECAAARLGDWASARNNPRLQHLALGMAIGLGGLAQTVRVPVALAGTGLVLTDGITHMLVDVGLAVCRHGLRWAQEMPQQGRA